MSCDVILSFIAVSPPPKQGPTARPRPQPSNGHAPGDFFNGSHFSKPNLGSNDFSSNTTSRKLGGTDLFGMDDFAGQNSPEASQQDLENAIGILDKRILEMKVLSCLSRPDNQILTSKITVFQDGFSRGLSFGNEDFSLESLDPLRN